MIRLPNAMPYALCSMPTTPNLATRSSQLATRNPLPVYFAIMWVTACSNPSIVSSNMGKISRMALMVRV